MKARSAWYIPTLELDESSYIFAEHPEWLQDPFLTHALQPALTAQFDNSGWRANLLNNQKQVAIAKASLAMNERNVKTLYDPGVNIGFGTDSGAVPVRIPGFAEHRELELLVDSGLTPLEAINLATGKAAALLQLDDRGVLAPGKLADMVVVDGTQLRKYGTLTKSKRCGTGVSWSAVAFETLGPKRTRLSRRIAPVHESPATLLSDEMPDKL